MSTGRFVAPGKTRSCPHCRATILDSATVCPGCHHHLRFGTSERPQEVATPLRVEGTLRHPPNGGAWEYSVVLSIRNDRGEEIARQIVGVGALNPAEARTFSLAVEVFKPAELKETKPQAAEAPARTAAGARTLDPPRAAGPRPADPRPGDPRAPGPRAPDPLAPAARPPSPRAPDPRGGGPRAPDPHAAGSRAADPHAADPRAPTRPAQSVPPASGTSGTRPGLAAAWPDALRPSQPPRSGATPAGSTPSRSSVFKDPRPPGSVPGLQPKRR